MIAAVAAGHAALKNTIAQRFLNPAALVGDLDDRFAALAVDQAFDLL